VDNCGSVSKAEWTVGRDVSSLLSSSDQTMHYIVKTALLSAMDSFE